MLARLQCVCIKHLKRFHISWLMSMVCDIHSSNMHSTLAQWKVSVVFFLSSSFLCHSTNMYSRPCGSFYVANCLNLLNDRKSNEKTVFMAHCIEAKFIYTALLMTHTGRWRRRRQRRTLQRLNTNGKKWRLQDHAQHWKVKCNSIKIVFDVGTMHQLNLMQTISMQNYVQLTLMWVWRFFVPFW